MTPGPGEAACDACLARAWLLARLGGHLETSRGQIDEALALAPFDLIAAVGGREAERVALEFDRLEVEPLRGAARRAGLETICVCHPEYPAALRELSAPPSVLHVTGGLERALCELARESVAVVGARAASAYGIEVARSLARGLAASGVAVISGMARGVDCAAHAGALEVPGGARTVAVLPGSAGRPYPASMRGLHRRIVTAGCAISELGPGAEIRRWTFPARNRLIAALARLTVVVEAGARSGSLVTAAIAARLGRAVGAVPGRVTSAQAQGTNELLAGGAVLIRDAQDVLDVLYGAGARTVPPRRRPALAPEPEQLLAALAGGRQLDSAIAHSGLDPQAGLAALAELELGGYVRRGAGGRYTVIP